MPLLPPPPPPAYIVPPTNDCCCQCGNPCRYLGRVKTHGSKIFSAPTSEVEEDPNCNSEKLRTVIEENIGKDPSESKRAIQKAAEAKLFAKFNVICAKGDFSYVAYTEKYCRASNEDITCYAFQPL
uniref:Ground-like domain-containing protein n=1 Tax=Steinernema glaseri TaxID=37863 RepID=A0A1I8ACE0_9BILA